MKIYLDQKKYALNLHHLAQNLGYDEIIFSEENSQEKRGEYLALKRKQDKIETVYSIDGEEGGISVSIDFDEKSAYMKALFLVLSRNSTTSQKSYGIQTGIRPVKLYRIHVKKYGREKGEEVLKEKYLMSKDKIDRLRGIYLYQEPYIKKMEGEVSVYVHIPFCLGKCKYCSYHTEDISKKDDLSRDYIKALIKEIESFKLTKPVSSIYVGGGTPSVLRGEDMERLLFSLEKFTEGCREYTYEMGRTDTVTKEKLKLLKKYSVDRISVNPQTTKDETNRLMGRRGGKEDFQNALSLAKEMGIERINSDIIIGFENEDKKDMVQSVKDTVHLNPEQITIHPLALKTKANLTGEENQKSDKMMLEVFDEIKRYLSESGYTPYYLYRQKRAVAALENIGYTKDGPCIYNVAMMDQNQSIIAFGAGASTKVDTAGKIQKRHQNPVDVGYYIENIDSVIDKKNREIKECIK